MRSPELVSSPRPLTPLGVQTPTPLNETGSKTTNATSAAAATRQRKESLSYGFITAGLIVLLLFLLRIIIYLKRSTTPTVKTLPTTDSNQPAGTPRGARPKEGPQATAESFPGLDIIKSYLKQGFEQNVPYYQLYTQLVKTGWAPESIQQAYRHIVEGK